MNPDDQLSLVLPRRSPEEIWREQLEDKVEAFNSTNDPAERIRLHHDIERLRGFLAATGGLNA